MDNNNGNIIIEKKRRKKKEYKIDGKNIFKNFMKQTSIEKEANVEDDPKRPNILKQEFESEIKSRKQIRYSVKSLKYQIDRKNVIYQFINYIKNPFRYFLF